jgi:hypothetical protein
MSFVACVWGGTIERVKAAATACLPDRFAAVGASIENDGVTVVHAQYGRCTSACWRRAAALALGDHTALLAVSTPCPFVLADSSPFSCGNRLAQALHQAIGPGEHGHGMDQIEDFKIG